MWFTTGQRPGPLPEVIYTPEGFSITNPLSYPEDQLNIWGWFKAPDIREYDYLYYIHDWEEPAWVYNVNSYELRKSRIEAKKMQYISLLRSWYREARYETLIGVPESPELLAYLNDLLTEINRLVSLAYENADIDTNLKIIDNFDKCKEDDLALNPQSLDFWYNYDNNSMPIKQRGGFGLV